MSLSIEHTQMTPLDNLCSIPADSVGARQYRNPACEHQPHGGALRDQRLFWRQEEKGTMVTEAAWQYYGYRTQ